MKQYSIFDSLNKFIIDKPIRLIELFGGYGSQNLALKYLTGKSCHYKLVEWASKSIQAYNDLHIRDYTDYSKELTDDEVLNTLEQLGVSYDYNNPMARKELKNRDYRKIYNNIKATNNLVDISRVHSQDLEIIDKDKYCYLMSYSFPCQDLSLAGQCKGMARNSQTRSSLLWQVERILEECKKDNCLPQVLVMENVTQVHGTKNKDFFQEWIRSLEDLGYSNYWQDLNAKDYGIPQNRDRTFMVSILGEYNYEFPRKVKPKYVLRDLLESNVDKKYFLSEKQIEQVKMWNAFQKHLETMKQTEKNQCRTTLTTRSSAFAGGMILVKDKIAIKNNTKQGYLLAEECDGVDISGRMQYHRGTVQKGKTQTITTAGGNNIGVVTRVVGGLGKKGSTNQYHLQDRIYEGNNSIAITTAFNPYYITNEIIKRGNYTPSGHNTTQVIDSNGVSCTVMENHGSTQATITDLGIRKLTPRECFRLQGLIDEDIDKISENQTDNSNYHLAGDSICCAVLIGIFGKLLGLTDDEVEDKIRNTYKY